MVRVCVAGVSGWVGRSLVPAIVNSPDLQLVGAVARSCAGKSIREAIGASADTVIVSSVEEALGIQSDVLVDYTKPDIVKRNVLAAIKRGVHVVIGTSGLTDDEYEEIDALAKSAGLGVLAAGNFAITAVLLQRLALVAAKHVPNWEIIDYAHADKVDAPSGTTRELAYRLSKIGTPQLQVPLERVHGIKESRGATVNGSQIHSVRLPGYVISAEVIFGLPDEKLVIRHEAGSGAAPYVGGTLLAVRAVSKFTGLRRGLDTIIDL